MLIFREISNLNFSILQVVDDLFVIKSFIFQIQAQTWANGDWRKKDVSYVNQILVREDDDVILQHVQRKIEHQLSGDNKRNEETDGPEVSERFIMNPIS